MDIAFDRLAIRDAEWVRSYYDETFVEGAKRFYPEFRAALDRLKGFPAIGTPHPTRKGLRVLRITRSPFALVYRIEA